MDQHSNTQAAIDAGKSLAILETEIEGIATVIHHKDMTITRFSELMPTPIRTIKSIELSTVESFVEYYNAYGNDHSVVYADVTLGLFRAVIDHHDTNSPAWGEHTATYRCPKTKEWSDWENNSGVKMNQVEFALFIEDHLTDIIDPEAAAMLEIATSLQAKNNVDFASATRLDNGETQFSYNETIEGKAGEKGQLQIPQTITIGLRLFEGGEGYELEARFRYRINNSNLVMWYDLIRPHRTHEHAVEQIVEQIDHEKAYGQLMHAKL